MAQPTLGPKTQLVWHGASQFVIVTGAVLAAIQAWPTPWQWITCVVAGVVAAIKGVDSLLTRRVE